MGKSHRQDTSAATKKRIWGTVKIALTLAWRSVLARPHGERGGVREGVNPLWAPPGLMVISSNWESYFSRYNPRWIHQRHRAEGKRAAGPKHHFLFQRSRRKPLEAALSGVEKKNESGQLTKGVLCIYPSSSPTYVAPGKQRCWMLKLRKKKRHPKILPHNVSGFQPS